MRKFVKYLLAILIISSFGIVKDVSAIMLNKDDIENSTYVIGKAIYTREELGAYKGRLTTSYIMLAAQTIEGNSIGDMIILYKNAKGEWINGLDSSVAVVIPEVFEIHYKNGQKYPETKKHTVTFNTDGGNEISSKEVNEGEKVEKPENPTKKGYKFLGWYLDDKEYDFSSEVKNNMTLKAKWLLENAYIASRTAADNEKLIGLDFTNEIQMSTGGIALKFTYPIDHIIVGSKKPTENIVKEADLSADKDGSVKAYIVKNETNYDLLIAAEDSRTIINLPTDSSYLFANIYADTITFNSNVNAKTVTDMSYMFVSSAWIIDLKNLDTSNVTNMKGMFSKEDKFINKTTGELEYAMYIGKAREKITRFYGDVDNNDKMNYVRSINALSALNVSKVTDMSYMFANSIYERIDLSNWDTSKVENMEYMFSGTHAGSSKLNGLKTSNVKNMSSMFFDSDLMSAEIENFDVSNVEDMSFMLAGEYYGELNLSKWNTSKVVDMSGVFYNYLGKAQFTKLNLLGWDTSRVIDMSNMFSGVIADSILGLENFDTSNVTNMSSMFGYIDEPIGGTVPTKIGNFDLSIWNFDTSKVTDMSFMFASLDLNGKNLDLSKLNTSNVTNMEGMFFDVTVNQLDLSNWNTSKVTNMSHMFSCIKANSIVGLNKFDTSKVTDMQGMFGTDETFFYSSKSTEIETLDIGNWDTSNVTNMSYMFADSKFKNLILTNFEATKLTNANEMFKGLTTEKLYIDKFDLTNVKDKYYAFEDLQNYDRLYIQTNDSMKNFITKNYPKYAGCFNM